MSERAQITANHQKISAQKLLQSQNLKQFSIESLIGPVLSKKAAYLQVKKKNRECSLYMVIDDSAKVKLDGYCDQLLK